MLSKDEILLIRQHAFIPEQLPHYVEAISSSEAHFHKGYLCFTRETHLLFVGYPLGEGAEDIRRAFHSACDRFAPRRINIIAPFQWIPAPSLERCSYDNYFKLDLPLHPLGPEVAYMVRRAERELAVTVGSLGKEHIRMIDAFCARKGVSSSHRKIFSRIPKYLEASETALLLEARSSRAGDLVSFLIMDAGSADYAFYLFHFRALEHFVPGASDLLVHEMTTRAASQGKSRINMGLGINQGIRRFKKKWGAVDLVPYHSATLSARTEALEPLFKKL